jgi:hypothetical protein
MIAIPPGRVTLSDRRTQRRWSVALAPYQLAAFAVTQAQYAQVTGRRPSTAQGDRLPIEGVSWSDRPGARIAGEWAWVGLWSRGSGIGTRRAARLGDRGAGIGTGQGRRDLGGEWREAEHHVLLWSSVTQAYPRAARGAPYGVRRCPGCRVNALVVVSDVARTVRAGPEAGFRSTPWLLVAGHRVGRALRGRERSWD